MYFKQTHIESVLLVLWIGGIWTVGYIVAPILFSTLADRSLAALVAGRLFSIMAIVGMGCASMLLVGFIVHRQTGVLRLWQFWVLITMLLLTAVGYFYLSPAIEALRQSGEAAQATRAFKLLHGTAAMFYLCTSLGGLALVISGIPRRTH